MHAPRVTMLFLAVVSFSLAGCSGAPSLSLTALQTSSSTSSQTPATPSDSIPNATNANTPAVAMNGATTTGNGQITQFKSTSIVLYTAPTGSDGQKVSTTSFVLPLSYVAESKNPGRLAIITVEGTRWLAKSAVEFTRAGSENLQPATADARSGPLTRPSP